MNLANFKSKFSALATTGGFTKFHFGWLDEFDRDNREGTYPALIVIPPDLPLKTRTRDEKVTIELEVYALNTLIEEYATTREAVWDGLNTKMVTLVQAIGTGTDFNVTNQASIPTELFPFGLSTDSVVGIKYQLNLEVFC